MASLHDVQRQTWKMDAGTAWHVVNSSRYSRKIEPGTFSGSTFSGTSPRESK
jgi:hypothetical protein